MSKYIKFAEGEYYHIYNRGTNKMEIFNDSLDYKAFMERLYVLNGNLKTKFSDIRPGSTWTIDKEGDLVDIIAWVLMPNHFHLLIRTKNDTGLSNFMQKLGTSFSMYYNKKHDRTGRLFEGTFKAKHITEDNYLKYLYSYIHLNPLKLIDKNWKENTTENLDEKVEFLKKYKYSSLLDYLNTNRDENKITNKDVAPDYFKESKDHLKEIIEWIKYEEI